MKKLQNRKGFTLVELLIVMAIIGILVLIAVPRFAKTTEMSKVRTVQANTRTIASAAGLYLADNSGGFATGVDVAGLMGELVTKNYLAKNLDGQPKGATYVFGGTKTALTITGAIDLNTNIPATDLPEGVEHNGADNKIRTVIQVN